jgi:CHASE3 domain sensor protein
VEDVIPLKALMTDVVTQMVNEETGVRGYIISGDPDALAPYSEGRNKVEENLNTAPPLLGSSAQEAAGAAQVSAERPSRPPAPPCE